MAGMSASIGNSMIAMNCRKAAPAMVQEDFFIVGAFEF